MIRFRQRRRWASLRRCAGGGQDRCLRRALDAQAVGHWRRFRADAEEVLARAACSCRPGRAAERVAAHELALCLLAATAPVRGLWRGRNSPKDPKDPKDPTEEEEEHQKLQQRRWAAEDAAEANRLLRGLGFRWRLSSQCLAYAASTVATAPAPADADAVGGGGSKKARKRQKQQKQYHQSSGQQQQQQQQC